MAYGAPMTFSIVGLDPDTGALGVAVHSHAFSVGSIVPWVEAGVGAVATQSLPLLEAGPRGLALLGEGVTAREVLDTLAGEDDAFASRQIGVVGADGSSASHTGEGCIPIAAHHVGEGLAVQGNILATDDVVPAMVQAFTDCTGDLQDRLLAALDAAQAAGGDLRGQQSAALVTVAGARSAPVSQQQRTQLHVDDHSTPLTELRRLLVLRRAYDRLEEADELVAAGQLTAAVSAYGEAVDLAPAVPELQFWAAVSMFTAGVEDDARARFRGLVADEPHWRDVLDRLAASSLFPDDLGDLGR